MGNLKNKQQYTLEIENAFKQVVDKNIPLTFPLPHEEPNILKEILKDKKTVLTLAGYGYGFSFLENSEVISIDLCPAQIAQNLILKSMCITFEYDQFIDIIKRLEKRKKLDENEIKKILSEIPNTLKEISTEILNFLPYYFQGNLIGKNITLLSFFPFAENKDHYENTKRNLIDGKFKIYLGRIPNDLELFTIEQIDGYYFSNITDHISFEEKKELCRQLKNSKTNSSIVFADIRFPMKNNKIKTFNEDLNQLIELNEFKIRDSFIRISPILETEIRYSIFDKK
ncbi:MAG: hypothetical protein WC356_05980 [Candidatus Micrarchaeia archaeon]|jgi:hypothetical protein